MKWITAQQLNDWSDSPQARVEFPALVASLIRASVPDISALRFPNGATGDMRGWDGHVVCDAGAGRVPTGDSYWELKTGKTAYAEGLKEFEARSKAMAPADRAKATYTFVASRTWNSDKKRPEDWENTCNGTGYGWARVRALDAVAVEDWLEQSPAVAAKFARFTLNTMPAQGARSTDEFCEDFRHSFDPALVEDVLLADRADRVKNLLQALQAGTGITQFISDSPDEAIAFGVAAIRSKKGPGTERAVDGNQGQLFDPRDVPVVALSAMRPQPGMLVSWFLLVYVDGDELRAELSCPVAIENGFFAEFSERIVLAGPGGGGDGGIRKRDDEPDGGPTEYDISVTRK